MRLILCAVFLLGSRIVFAARQETVEFAKTASRFLSLQPVTRPTVPTGVTASANPIDAFIGADYKSKGAWNSGLPMQGPDPRGCAGTPFRTFLPRRCISQNREGSAWDCIIAHPIATAQDGTLTVTSKDQENRVLPMLQAYRKGAPFHNGSTAAVDTNRPGRLNVARAARKMGIPVISRAGSAHRAVPACQLPRD
jgi:hypothetical protein